MIKNSLKHLALFTTLLSTTSIASDIPVGTRVTITVTKDGIVIPNTLQTVPLDQFKALSSADLIQSSKDRACVLYSFLWAVHENQILTKAFLSNIKTFEDRYYIKNPITGKIYMISQEDIQTVDSTLHPSRDPLFRAIGLYVLAALNDYLGGEIPAENFVLSADGKDLFFAENTLDLRKKRGDHLTLNPDGTIYVVQDKGQKAEIISGDFIISVAGRSHARAVYFDENKRHWFQFNNQSAASSKRIVPVPAGYLNYPGILVIGFMKVHDEYAIHRWLHSNP